MRCPQSWRSTLHLALFVALAGCASKSSIPANDSSVNIQASTTATSDVKFIEIIVHQLSDGSLVYDSGIQPSSDFQDTRQHLEENVPLQSSTDFLFDAKAFDVNQVLLKNGNQVQEATQPAGTSTTVLIVIDLNAGDTGVTSPADITAVTDNIPVIYPPTLVQSGGSYTLNYKATDTDQDADGGPPIDSNETLTFFSSILSGNVDLSANVNPGLFTEGQTFSFVFNDNQPVRILSAVVDRLNQLTFAITEIDPSTGSFQTVEYGEGYALFDDNTIVPGTKKSHDRNTGSAPQPDPTGPHSGTIAVTVLKHVIPPANGIVGTVAVEAITRSDDSLVVTPNNVAYWDSGVVQSFNRYEEQPNSDGTIIVDYKLRVQVPTPADTLSAPASGFTIDTMKFIPSSGSFIASSDLQEAGAVLPTPSINMVTDGSGGTDFAPGSAVIVDGADFSGGIPFAVEIDDRQIYLQQGGTYAYPVNISSPDYQSVFSFGLPANIGAGTWDVVVCSYGRICVTESGAISISTAIGPSGGMGGSGSLGPSGTYEEVELVPSPLPYASEANWINDSDVIVGEVFGASGSIAVAWNEGEQERLPGASGTLSSAAYFVGPSGNIAGTEGPSAEETHATIWCSVGCFPHELNDADGYPINVATSINASGLAVGYALTEDQQTSIAVVWGSSGNVNSLFVNSGDGTNPTANAINNSGEISGNIIVSGGVSTGVVWANRFSADTVLQTPVGDVAFTSWMNNLGQIVGCANGSANSQLLPVYWASLNDAPIEMPLPDGATTGCVTAITDSGLISGYTDVGPAVWIPGNGGWFIDLLPIVSGSPYPASINSSGEVAGWDLFFVDGNLQQMATFWLRE